MKSPSSSCVLLCALALTSCSDFASPAGISRLQILAIQSEPPSLGPGQSAELRVLLADSEGPVTASEVHWSVEPGFSPSPMGHISMESGVPTYTAPMSLPPSPTLISLDVRIEVEASMESDRETLRGVKGILLGGPPLSNPSITGILINGSEAQADLVLDAGAESSLGVQLQTPPSPKINYAWYASPGTISEYRSSPTKIVAPNAPDAGWLYVVVRDRGGIAFASQKTTVQ